MIDEKHSKEKYSINSKIVKKWGGNMPGKKNCEISTSEAEKGYDACRMLSVVDAAKSDMEYICCGCENK